MMNCDNSGDLVKLQSFFEKSQREKLLETTIEKAIVESEKTKKSFRSKKIKEVREMMMEATGL